MDNLKLIGAVLALIAVYIVLVLIGLPVIVAVLAFIIGFIILVLALGANNE